MSSKHSAAFTGGSGKPRLKAEERLELASSGLVCYTLKAPYRDGTTHIVLEPLDLMARLLGHRQTYDPAPCGHDLGAAPQARLRH